MAEATVHTTTMSAPPDDVNVVHDLLERVWADSPSISMEDRFSFETALIELAANVIRHADGGSGVSCILAIRTASDSISATLVDSGIAGDIDLGWRDMPDELEESGRGIALIKALVDDLHYDIKDDLNRWRISRKLRT